MERRQISQDSTTIEEIIECAQCKDLFLEIDSYQCDICQIYMCDNCMTLSGKWCLIPNISRPHKANPLERRPQIVCSYDCYEIFLA